MRSPNTTVIQYLVPEEEFDAERNLREELGLGEHSATQYKQLKNQLAKFCIRITFNTKYPPDYITVIKLKYEVVTQWQFDNSGAIIYNN